MTKTIKCVFATLAVTACIAIGVVQLLRGVRAGGDKVLVQRLEDEHMSVSLIRKNYHATVSYVYEVEACSKIHKRCETVFQGMGFGKNAPSIKRLDGQAISISGQTGLVMQFSNFFDYGVSRGSRVRFVLDVKDIPK